VGISHSYLAVWFFRNLKEICMISQVENSLELPTNKIAWVKPTLIELSLGDAQEHKTRSGTETHNHPNRGPAS
jgi:hypothetical protein